MARTIIAPGIALHFAFLAAKRNAAKMRADANRDQPIGVAWLGALGQRLWVAQLGGGERIGRRLFSSRQIAHENRLTAPDGNDRLPRLNTDQIDVGTGHRQHVGRRVHLVDERPDGGAGPDCRKAARSDANKIPATFIVGMWRAQNKVCHVMAHRCVGQRQAVADLPKEP